MGIFLGALSTASTASSKTVSGQPQARTVLGPVAPEKLGTTLMHEHAPIIDWSELYEAPPAPLAPIREKLLTESAAFLNRFHEVLAEQEQPGTIVEVTPIRVGRYPQLLQDLARQAQELAEPQEGLGAALQRESAQAAKELSVDAAAQGELNRKTEALARRSDATAQHQATAPLDATAARQALDRLKRGNR